MKYLDYSVKLDKTVMLNYIKGYYSDVHACKYIGQNNSTVMTMKEFYEATWKWGFLPKYEAEKRYQEYLRKEVEKNVTDK